MKDLFMAFLDLLDCRGKITEALMYSTGTFSKITAELDGGIFEISITKKDEENENA